MTVNTQRYNVTQNLIEKYYEHILGGSYRNTAANRNRENRCPSKLNHSDVNNSGSTIRMESSKTSIDTDDNLNKQQYFQSDDTNTTKFYDYQKTNSSSNATSEEYVSFLPKCKSFLHSLFAGDYERDLLIERIQAEKHHAMSYDEWKEAGIRLDSLTNKVQWKQQPESNLYDYKLLQDLTQRLCETRLEGNYAELLYLIRTNWVRNLGNMGDVNLYRQSHVGTKYLIDDYLAESKLCLDALLNHSELDDDYLLGILQQTRRNIGRTALVLSGGGTFGLFHIGVLATLFELDMLPRVISGSSAGAIIASILSVHHKDEIPELLERVLETEFNIFKDDNNKSAGRNYLIKISRFFKNSTWFDNKHLVSTMISFLGDLTFREAYNRTGKILNITVSPASLFEQPRLLNNLTAPNVLIWSAVCASCSLPGIFPPTMLYEKDLKTGETREWNGSRSVKFVDGSVDNDLPISRLSEMFNVDHIIACQVNLHVFPFLKLALSCVGGDIQDEFSARFKQNLASFYNHMANELIHVMEMGGELGIAKNFLTKARSVLSQQYSGDITILPDIKMVYRFNELLTNPTKEFLLKETTNGARATWPKVSIIQNHCGQELALDKAITYLKGKIIVSSSIKNPLQFSDIPIGLIKSQIHKEELVPENSHLASVLDDNLLEDGSSNSLLLLRENGGRYRRASNAKFMFSTFSRTPTSKQKRRMSDMSSRSRNIAHSLSFSASSPTSRLSRFPIRYGGLCQGYYKNHSSERLYNTKHSESIILQRRKGFEGIDSAPVTGQANSIIIPSPRSAKIEGIHSIGYGMVNRIIDKERVSPKIKLIKAKTNSSNVFSSESENEQSSPTKRNESEQSLATMSSQKSGRLNSTDKVNRRTSVTPVKSIRSRTSKTGKSP